MATAIQPSGGTRVLLLDSDEANRRLLQDVLGPRFLLTAVADGEAALGAVRDGAPDLVISELLGPGPGGLGLLRALRAGAATRAVPVILMAPAEAEERAIDALGQGADDYLLHPFTPRQLLARVAIQLRLGSARREADGRIEDFAHAVIHELRAPLTVVKGYAQILRMRLDRSGPTEVPFVAKMEHGIQRIEVLVRDLADLTRIQGGRLILHRDRCDLAALCRKVAEDQEVSCEQNVALDVPEAPVLVEADAERICQVLTNLLMNALRHSPEECPVTLSLRLAGGEAIISIRDEGPGIPRERLPHLFDRFHAAPGPRVAAGVGLYISRELVERHAGRIWAESPSGGGGGSTFFVALPSRQAADGAVADQSVAAVGVAG